MRGQVPVSSQQRQLAVFGPAGGSGAARERQHAVLLAPGSGGGGNPHSLRAAAAQLGAGSGRAPVTANARGAGPRPQPPAALKRRIKAGGGPAIQRPALAPRRVAPCRMTGRPGWRNPLVVRLLLNGAAQAAEADGSGSASQAEASMRREPRSPPRSRVEEGGIASGARDRRDRLLRSRSRNTGHPAAVEAAGITALRGRPVVAGEAIHRAATAGTAEHPGFISFLPIGPVPVQRGPGLFFVLPS